MNELKNIYVDIHTGEWVVKKANDDDYKTTSLIATQNNPAYIWHVNHGMNTNTFVVQVYSDDLVVYPDNIQIINDNEVQISFNTAITGQANFMFF